MSWLENFPYGGRNDEALLLMSETDHEMFVARALKDTGEIMLALNCNDIFAWGCADAEELPYDQWEDFEARWTKALLAGPTELPKSAFAWFAAAWSVKLRGVAPQKPATDRYPEFVAMLDWLGVPWREMERYDQMARTGTEREC